MNRGKHEAKVLESLEHVTVFFVTSFFSWNKMEEAHRPQRYRFLPNPSLSCSLLSSLRVTYLATIAHSYIQQNKVLTKRDIYYMCRHLFKNPAVVDRALETLSSIAGVDRNDLNIVAAPKGIVVGNVTFVDETANEIRVGMFGIEGCLIPSRPERMARVSVNAKAIIVIEKEASFHCLLHESASQEFFSSCVLVTGKGYPDHATRLFIKRMILASHTQGEHIPTYILTDADPHGICIAICYLSSLSDDSIKWLGVKPSDNGKIFQVDPRSLLPLQKSESALLDSLLQKWSNYASNSSGEYTKLWNELNFIKNKAVKFEMEAISVIQSSSGPSGLLEYLITNICNEREEATVAQTLLRLNKSK